MKKVVVILVICLIMLIPLTLAQESNFFQKVLGKLTGKSTEENSFGPPAPKNVGPSQEEQDCMIPCVSIGCNSENMTCMQANSEKCMIECNVQKPETTEETSCMEECILEGCTEFDFICQNNNKNECEEECNMIKEPESKSEEESCIRECVEKKAPGTICEASAEGEKGDKICQKCAEECVYLYAGPCIDDKEIRQKEKECEKPCKHCYGEPVMGDSGEGWECIIDVTCKDASNEFGDNPGEGEGISFTEKVKNFFQEIFGGNKEDANNLE